MERKWSGGAELRASRRPQSFGFGPDPINGQLSPYKYHTEGGKGSVFVKGDTELIQKSCVFAPNRSFTSFRPASSINLPIK